MLEIPVANIVSDLSYGGLAWIKTLKLIKSCHPCQVTGQPSPPTPIHSTPLPNGPWEYLALDICGPFPTGEYALVLIDYYSRWAEVEITTSTTNTTSARILKWLDFVCNTWLSSHITNRQRKIFHLCKIPTHPHSMGNQAPYCHGILPAGKWVSRAVQQNPVDVYSHVLGRGKKLDGDETHYSPKNDPKPLPAPLLPLPTDPPLRRSTRHRKPPDFFQHS